MSPYTKKICDPPGGRRSWGLSLGQIAYVLRACAGYRRRAEQLRADELGAACCRDLFDACVALAADGARTF
eukprot:scaffold3344_cov138-Isochrysis_galbana.AAC.1